MKKNNVYSVLLIVTLSLIVAIRGNTRDSSVYKRIFENINYFNLSFSEFYESSGVEIGYGFLSYLVKIFTDNYIVLFFIISFLTFYSLYIISKHTNINFYHILLSYLPTFFIPHQLMQIRQGFAAAVVYLAIFYYIDSKRFKALSIWIVATLFHTISWSVSWIFFIPVKFINKLKEYADRHPLIYYLALLTLTIIASRFLLDILPDLNDRIGGYSESEEYNSERSILHPANLRTYLLFLFFLMHFKYLKNNKYYFVFLTLYTMGLGFRVGFYDFIILSGRLGSFFTYTEIFLFPIVISVYKGKIIRTSLILIYFILSLYINLAIQYTDIIDLYFTPLV